jgi:hypothetical protein
MVSTYHTTWCHNPEAYNLNIHHHENLITYTGSTLVMESAPVVLVITYTGSTLVMESAPVVLVITYTGSTLVMESAPVVLVCRYEGESVNRSHLATKRETCDIRTCNKHLLPDISSSNIDTLVPSLYQQLQTRNSVLSQPFPHLHFNLFVISETSATQL